jgi:transposase-like protein
MPIYNIKNAKTTVHIRKLIKSSNLSYAKLAAMYGLSKATISKWKKRDNLENLSSKPHNINYSLSQEDIELIIKLRTTHWFTLDEIVEMVFPENPNPKRSAVYRIFKKNNINIIPKEQKEKAYKFKEYEPGYIHVDVTYFPKIDGKKQYLYVGIDRATRLLYYKRYDAKTAENTKDFVEGLINFMPFKISHILTDNGLEFTNLLRKSKKGNTCNKPSLLDVFCKENNIEHRLTQPNSPQTNGMVEKANGTIKNGTTKRNIYKNLNELDEDLIKFLIFYNISRRHGGLRKELNVKTPLDALKKWYELKPEIFKIKPDDFLKNLLSLQKKI